MRKTLCLGLFAALVLTGHGAFAADSCTSLTATGHPQYPAIAFKDGDNIAGAAASLVEAIGKEIKVPVTSKYTGSWADAQAAARDGKVDIIFGIYFNDSRAKYLDYVQPAFMFDPVVVFVAKDRKFPYSGQDDLIGKKGATNQGESYGTEFDAFIKDKLDVERTDGIDDALQDLAAGKVDYVIAGYYPGVAEADKAGLKDKIEAVDPALLSAEMYVAFSKKSACRELASKFGDEITAMTTDGRFDSMLTDAEIAWRNAQAANK